MRPIFTSWSLGRVPYDGAEKRSPAGVRKEKGVLTVPVERNYHWDPEEAFVTGLQLEHRHESEKNKIISQMPSAVSGGSSKL